MEWRYGAKKIAQIGMKAVQNGSVFRDVWFCPVHTVQLSASVTALGKTGQQKCCHFASWHYKFVSPSIKMIQDCYL